MEPLTLAELAYQAYGSVTDFKNFRGEPMPAFKDLPETIQKAWEAATAKCAEETRLEVRQAIIDQTERKTFAILMEARAANDVKYSLNDIKRRDILSPTVIEQAYNATWRNFGNTLLAIVLDGWLPPEQEATEVNCVQASING